MMKHLKEEKTFVLIKPDGVQKGLIGEIIKRFEQRDLKIVALELFQPTVEEIDKHYPKDPTWIARLALIKNIISTPNRSLVPITRLKLGKW